MESSSSSDRLAELEDSLVAWQDKYERLYESHKRVQKQNQKLEDRLLRLADDNTLERNQWSSDVAKLSVSLADANYLNTNLRREIDRYKNDMSLAIQLLRCNPQGFATPKTSPLLPEDVHKRLTAKLDSGPESSHNNVMYRVLPASESPPPGMCPFPPTAMVYSMRGVDAEFEPKNITPALVAKYLEDELLNGHRLGAHCRTCQCETEETIQHFHESRYTIATQTVVSGDTNNSLCLRCNSNLNSPSRHPSLVTKLPAVVKPTEEDVDVIPPRKDELQVNPILLRPTRIGSDRRTCESSNASASNNNPMRAPKKEDIPVPLRDPSEPLPPGKESSFNNMLIKNIKMSEHMSKSMNRPRICSIRITEGSASTTANILLENAESDRPLSCDMVSIVSQEVVAPVAQVYTKRSKYLDEELDSKEIIVGADRAPPTQDGPVALIELNNHIAMENHGHCPDLGERDQSAFLLDDPVPLVGNLLVMDTTRDHQGQCANQPLNSMRQEQFDRVAVWVQQSNKQQQHELQSPTESLGDPMNGALAHSECNHVELRDSKRPINESVAGGKIKSVCIDIDDHDVRGPDDAEGPNLGLDIAQMEYNVKQFLLKQNEWSIGRMAAASTTSPSHPINGHDMSYLNSPSSSSFASSNHLRTETNL